MTCNADYCTVGGEDCAIPVFAASSICTCTFQRQDSLNSKVVELLIPTNMYGCCLGLAVFAWLSLVVHKANDVLRKQVALKTEYSRLHCILLAVTLTCHVPIVLLCLRSDQLWHRFYFLTPSPVPMVSLASEDSGA